ncbi:SDR family oxidoreductase [Halocynthiibacter styelae]|uniref:SDR family oxidoreductase n=1 Tax=Halocynthiibacter styelae TaxID=2761955 RepID=A0A8J7IS39_9RHOB|nr:SDR family oxidoreductase [Paenihalocynthiibacter styelae]MBI1494511.1 SDR family oxidoreductase [Paenihalocynthiibacter styelae]
MKQTILATGASSGFGRLIVKKFHDEGWNVIATMRSPEKKEDLSELENVLVERLDVNDQDSIEKAVAAGIDAFGDIHALVNNAGYGGFALFEQFSDEDARAMFDTNFFGALATSRAVLPMMRKNGAGAIINITSIAGFFAGPMVSIYSASKFALEGLTESLAYEYGPLGINVRSVAPGSFGTGFLSASVRKDAHADEALSSWGNAISKHIEATRANMRAQGGSEPNPELVAEKVFECVTQDTPIHNTVGADADMMLSMLETMPHQDFLDQMAKMLLPPAESREADQS